MRQPKYISISVFNFAIIIKDICFLENNHHFMPFNDLPEKFLSRFELSSTYIQSNVSLKKWYF
jgi:hypothetical protein